jgi:hypothetical protein
MAVTVEAVLVLLLWRRLSVLAELWALLENLAAHLGTMAFAQPRM